MGEHESHFDLQTGRTLGELSIVVRQMIDSDAEEIHEIHSECLTRTLASYYTPEQIAAWMKGRKPTGYISAANGGERFLVAEADGCIVGFASWQDGELLSLFVHPDSQGLGVGSYLLEVCLKDAAAQGAPITRLKAARGADQFYTRRGFVPIAQGSTVKNGEVIQDTRMIVTDLAPSRNNG